MPVRVLVIEDNPTNLYLVVYLLTAFGYVPLAAVSGEEGLEIALREKPDLILCDVQLPGIDGYELARRLKGDPLLRGVPLVALTALAMVGDRDKVLGSGFDGYIAKPIEPETFLDHMQSFLTRVPSARPAPAPHVPTSTDEGTAVPYASRHARVLVLDDSPSNLDVIRDTLEPLGFFVVTATLASEALRLARESPPDLVISDMHLNRGSGLDFLARLKEDPRLRDIPFIVLTSSVRKAEEEAAAIAAGAASFLERPVEPQVLLAEVEACLPRTAEERGEG